MGKSYNPKIYVLPGAVNAFGVDIFVLFNLWEMPKKLFCININVLEMFKQKLWNYLKEEVPQVFTEVFVPKRKPGFN